MLGAWRQHFGLPVAMAGGSVAAPHRLCIPVPCHPVQRNTRHMNRVASSYPGELAWGTEFVLVIRHFKRANGAKLNRERDSVGECEVLGPPARASNCSQVAGACPMAGSGRADNPFSPDFPSFHLLFASKSSAQRVWPPTIVGHPCLSLETKRQACRHETT